MQKFFIAKAYNTAGNETSCGPSKSIKPSTLADAKKWAEMQLRQTQIDKVVIFEAIVVLERVTPIIETKATKLLLEPEEMLNHLDTDQEFMASL